LILIKAFSIKDLFPLSGESFHTQREVPTVDVTMVVNTPCLFMRNSHAVLKMISCLACSAVTD
jgi:hypothetical protein